VGNCFVNLGKKSLIYISNYPPFIIKNGGSNVIEYHGSYAKFIAILPTLHYAII
jgi:hypothetical protein